MLYKCFKDVLKDVLGWLYANGTNGYINIKGTDWEY